MYYIRRGGRPGGVSNLSSDRKIVWRDNDTKRGLPIMLTKALVRQREWSYRLPVRFTNLARCRLLRLLLSVRDPPQSRPDPFQVFVCIWCGGSSDLVARVPTSPNSPPHPAHIPPPTPCYLPINVSAAHDIPRRPFPRSIPPASAPGLNHTTRLRSSLFFSSRSVSIRAS